MSVFLVVAVFLLVLLLAIIAYRVSRIQSLLTSILNQNLNMRDDSYKIEKILEGNLYKMKDELHSISHHVSSMPDSVRMKLLLEDVSSIQHHVQNLDIQR